MEEEVRPGLSLLLGSADSTRTRSSPLNEWDLGAPVVEGAGDEDCLAAFGPADHGGPRLLSRPPGVLQVLLPRYELFVPGELEEGSGHPQIVTQEFLKAHSPPSGRVGR